MSSLFQWIHVGSPVEGYGTVHKFGYNAGIDTNTDPEDIWDVGGLHPGLQTAGATTVVSSDANDTAAGAGGSGARTVEIFGLGAGYVLFEFLLF